MDVVVHEKHLSAVLSDFARTMVTDYPIQSILDRLVERIVDVLPVHAAGVTLISPDTAPHYIAASDAYALGFERLQTELGQGPCLEAYQSGDAVAVPNLIGDKRFPRFGPAAAADGLAAVFAFPLRHGEGRLGALDLYRNTPGGLAPHDMDAAQTLADVVAAYLLNAQAREEARETSDRFRERSLHDVLTGLPNRLLLRQRLEHAALRAQRSHTSAAVLFADLDQFKRVNDSYGHQVGDELLLAVAQRLSSLVRPGDTLARVSGDEFVFLCEDLNGPADVMVLAHRIDEAFSTPFLVNNTELPVTASVGVAFAGPGEEVSDQLVVNADIAMYQAKQKGGATHQILDLREARQSSDRDRLERDLRIAFARDRLAIAYQPIVRASDGMMVGVEALLRWADVQQAPTAAMVSIAEQNGLIGGIGSWVLERSCRDRRQWLREHPHVPLELAVNVSARQILGPDFCAIVQDVLTRTGTDAGSLVLEMTENIFIDDGSRAVSVLADLKALGVRLALDDFGTGYSSLSYLRRFPVDIVKIDQGFIADIGRDPCGSAIVAAVTNLAHVLGLSVTAEGVETGAQHREVVAIGCESAQGYYYSRPLAASAIGDRLAARPSPSGAGSNGTHAQWPASVDLLRSGSAPGPSA